MKEPKSRPRNSTMKTRHCQVCHLQKPVHQMVPGALVRPSVSSLIAREHPDWSDEGYICLPDLHRYRMMHVQEVVAEEVGEVSDLEHRVLDSLNRRSILAEEVLGDYEGKLGPSDRLADQIAGFGGSWQFIILFFAILITWMLINTVALSSRPFDPYPFILLNLALSCLAAIQAPIIMMSQNRQESKDRARSEHDYQVNLKAELEIRHLHEKMDHLLVQQWQRMMEIQQVQTELIDELVDWHRARKPGEEG